MNNVAALTEEGAFALFFGPHPGGFDSSRVPTREFAIQGKKKLTGIDWCIRKTLLFSRSDKRQDLAWNRQQTEWNIAHKWSHSYLQKPAYGSMPLEPAETSWN